MTERPASVGGQRYNCVDSFSLRQTLLLSEVEAAGRLAFVDPLLGES